MATFKNYFNEAAQPWNAEEFGRELKVAMESPEPEKQSEEFYFKLVAFDWVNEFLNLLIDKNRPIPDTLVDALILNKRQDRYAHLYYKLFVKNKYTLPKNVLDMVATDPRLARDFIERFVKQDYLKLNSFNIIPKEILKGITAYPQACLFIAQETYWKCPEEIIQGAMKSQRGLILAAIATADEHGKIRDDLLEKIKQSSLIWREFGSILDAGFADEEAFGIPNTKEVVEKVAKSLPFDILNHLKKESGLVTLEIEKRVHRPYSDAIQDLSYLPKRFLQEYLKTVDIKQIDYQNLSRGVFLDLLRNLSSDKILEIVKLYREKGAGFPQPLLDDLINHTDETIYKIGEYYHFKDMPEKIWFYLGASVEASIKVLNNSNINPNDIPFAFWQEYGIEQTVRFAKKLLSEGKDIPPEAIRLISQDGYELNQLLKDMSPEQTQKYISHVPLKTYLLLVKANTIKMDSLTLAKVIEKDKDSTDFNFLEDIQVTPEIKEAVLKNQRAKRFYLIPRKNAESYNKNFAGFFFHATRNVSPFMEPRKTGEICISTLDSDKTFHSNLVLVGSTNIRLLFDFDCYSEIDYQDPKKRRFATDRAHELQKLDLDKQSKSERLKSVFGPKMLDNHYYDEGFSDIRDLDIFFVTGDSEQHVEKASNLLKVPVIEFAKFEALIKNHKIIDFMYDILEGKVNLGQQDNTEEDPEEKYAALVKETVSKHIAGLPLIIEDGENPTETIPAVTLEDKIKSAFNLNEAPVDIRKFTLADLSPEEIDKVYETVNQTYEKSIGGSWSKEDFIHAASLWTFYGDITGFITAREQASGLVKLTGAAGANLPKLRGLKLLISENVPIWGMMTKDVADMATKVGLIKPPGMLTKLLFPLIPKSVFGKVVIKSVQWDGGVVIEDERLGKELVKYFLGNKLYFMKLLDNQNIPETAKKLIKDLV